jgi:predicted RecA/RadA family phage recombinase
MGYPVMKESGLNIRLTAGQAYTAGMIVAATSTRGGGAFGIALQDAASGDELDIATEGVFTEIPKVSGEAFAKFDKLYIDSTTATALKLTKRPVGPHFGYAMEVAGSTDTTATAFVDGTTYKDGGVICLSGVLDSTGGRAIGTHNIPGLVVPAGYNIKQSRYRVTTTHTSGGSDAATIALAESGGSTIVTAVAISNGGNPWDSGGWVAGAQDGTAANISTTTATAARPVQATIATQALTAGVMIVQVECVPANA